MSNSPARITALDGRKNIAGSRIKERRLALGLLQEQVRQRILDVTGKRWQIGPQEILRIENGTRTITDIELLIVARVLECDAGSLLVSLPDFDDRNAD